MEGLLFSIKRYSVHDGPGIRVTFFLKGCPLSCLWCHNPEGITPVPSWINETRRIGEREFVRKKTIGNFYNVFDLLELAGRDRIFMEQSGGGVTFSGGEPLMQPLFLREALSGFKSAGYHTAVDTSGHCSQEDMKSILPFTDLFLFDLKHANPDKHKQLTGSCNRLILRNLEMLIDKGSRINLRIPVIPGLNDDEKSLSLLRQYIMSVKNNNILRISLLPYHRTGSSKQSRMGIAGRMDECRTPGREEMTLIGNFFADTGIEVRTGG